MRRSDGMIKAILRVCCLPLLGAKWTVEPVDEKDSQGIDIAKKVEANLLTGMSLPWEKCLFQILQYLSFGFYAFEKIWEKPEAPQPEELQIKIKKLAPRHPKTIKKWIFDENGGLQELEQWAYFNVNDASTYKQVKIPIDKLIIFINEQEGDNYEGVSILRPCYKHWKIKETIYNISNIGIERMAVGYPIIKFNEKFFELSDTEQTTLKEVADDVLNNYRVNEKSGAKLPYQMELDIKEGKLNIGAIDRLIWHHDNKIAQSVLANFLVLGESGGGSFALSKDQSDFFLQSLEAVGRDICSTVNNFLVKPLVDYNFDNVTSYPELNFEINTSSTSEILNLLRLVVDGRIVQPDIQIEQYARRLLDLPELSEEEINARNTMPKINTNNTTAPAEVAMSEAFIENNPVWRRELTKAEKNVNFADIKKQMLGSEEKLKSEVKKITEKQVISVIGQIKKGKKLNEVTVPLMEDIMQLFTAQAKQLAEYGQEQITKELKADVKKNKNIEGWAKVRGQLLAEKHKSDLLVYIANNIKGGV